MSQRNRGRPKKLTSLSEPVITDEESASESTNTDDETSSALSSERSTETIVSLEETDFVNDSSSKEVIYTPKSNNTTSRIQQRNNNSDIENIAIRLNNLIDKKARYESHKLFLSKCVEEELIPEALKYSIEPSIGNRNDEFLTKWYQIQKECSLKLMKLTMDFCDKTLEDTNLTARNLEEKVKANTINAAFLKLKYEIKVQENKVKLRLQRKKTQKLNNLRYGIKPEVQNQRKHNPKINSTEQKQQGRLEPVRNKSATKITKTITPTQAS